jgi:hypothetical protein
MRIKTTVGSLGLDANLEPAGVDVDPENGSGSASLAFKFS